MDLAMYVSRASPELLIDEIRNYRSKKNSDWSELFERATKIPDDGHVSKFVRAVANGERVSKEFEGRDEFIVKGDDWIKIGNMGKSFG